MKNKVNKYLLCLLFLFAFQIGSAQVKFEKPDNKYLYCFIVNNENTEEGKWTKVYNNPSKRLIKKIQNRMNFVGFPVVETGVLDYQTINQIKKFNLDNNLGCTCRLMVKTELKLNKLYREKKNNN